MFRINRLLLDLYSCPTDKSRWPVVLDQVRRTLEVQSAVLQIIYPYKGHLRSRWMARDSRSEAVGAIHDRYFADDVNPRMLVPYRAFSDDQPIVRDSDIFYPDDPLLSDLNTRLAAAGLGRYMGAHTRISDTEVLTLVLHRDPNDDRDFNQREERLALELLPHFHQTIKLTDTLLDAQRQAHYLHEAMDSFRFAMLICNANGSLCWSNAAARRILENGGLLWLNGSGLLTARCPSQTTALRAAIARAARESRAGDEPQVFALSHNGSGVLHVRVQALEQRGTSTDRLFSTEGRALLVLMDPNSRPSLPPELLKQLFGLSPAESRLASALCFGATLNEYAIQAGVAISTARYQLKQIMAKMQVSKQSQLVQRLCSSVILHMARSEREADA
ncbi:MAG TPA: helix-turn-helix transcriptional regulator [Steroidobacteraceae bacterium]